MYNRYRDTYATCTICIWSFLPGEWFHYSNNDIENSHLLSYAKSMLFMDFVVILFLLFELICSGYYGG